MNIISIIGIALIAASLVLILRKQAPEFALPVSVVASLIILTVSMVFGSEIFKKIEEISENSNISTANIKIVFKSLGICYITQIGKDVCRDCGETAIADKVDLAGKIAIASLSLPLLTQVIELITEIIS